MCWTIVLGDGGRCVGKLIRFSRPRECDDEFEKCVACGRKTKVKKSENVEIREHYIEGAGQLCHECFAEISRSTR